MRPDTLALDTLYPLSQETMAYGEAMASALLGLDALARGEAGEEAGLVILNMDRHGHYPPEDFSSYAEARARFQELATQSHFLPELDRKVYYHELCASTLAYIEWRQDGLLFRYQLDRLLHVPVEPVSDQELDVLRGELHQLLGEMGFKGPLADRCADWEARNRVPPESVPAVLQEMLTAARARAEASLLPIPILETDGLTVVPVRGTPFVGRCDYSHRTLEVNTEPVLTWPALRHLAVKEGYGGHFLHYRIREHYVEEGLAPADNLLGLRNSASSTVFEGIGRAGMEMMGWGESDNDRLYYILSRLRAGLLTRAAWDLHARGWALEDVQGWLCEECLVGGREWSATQMRFMTNPERALRLWGFWWGEPTVAEAWWKIAPDDRQEFLRFLYGRMHSTRSVAMFAP